MAVSGGGVLGRITSTLSRVTPQVILQGRDFTKELHQSAARSNRVSKLYQR
jgi:hypothetical protein